MSDAVWKILSEFGETERSNVWTVQSATVIKHACLERVAAKAGVVFSAPTILRAERDEAVILVTGHRENRTEWSIGEALVNGNYRVTGKMAAYPFAMAEKRAKDRVILKLINLHGLAYSEDEADDFKEAPAPRETVAPAKTQKGAPAPKAQDDGVFPDEPPPNVAALLHSIGLMENITDLKTWAAENKAGIDALDDIAKARVRGAYAERQKALAGGAAA